MWPQPGDVLPHSGGTPGHPCAELAREQQNRPPPGTQKREEVKPPSAPLPGSSPQQQDSLQRQQQRLEAVSTPGQWGAARSSRRDPGN